MNLATIRAQAQKMAEYEAKRKKMLDEYNHQISHRVDQLPITKISYRVNSSKEASMRIHRAITLLNLIRGTPEAEEMFKKIGLTIEARDDVDQARKIVQDNLETACALPAFTHLSNLQGRPQIHSAGLYKFTCKVDTLSNLLVQRTVSVVSGGTYTIRDDVMSKRQLSSDCGPGSSCQHAELPSYLRIVDSVSTSMSSNADMLLCCYEFRLGDLRETETKGPPIAYARLRNCDHNCQHCGAHFWISSISIGSSNVQPSESPYLPVPFIGTSQSRQHDKSESVSYCLTD
ncbi:hypothetical protein Tco_0390199 [Tanacetum coccineum]